MRAVDVAVTISPNSTQRRKKVKHRLLFCPTPNSARRIGVRHMFEYSTEALSWILCSHPLRVFKAGDNEEAIAPRSAPYVR